MSEWLNVGKIVNTHGISGEVRVITQSDFADERYKVGSVLHFFHPDKATSVPLVIRSHRQHKQFDLLAFENYPSINDVTSLKGGLLKVSKSQLSELPEGEYYYFEIIGCDVYTNDRKKVGRVSEVLSPGANDVWVVSGETTKDVLIPYIDDVVQKVDVKNKEILIKPMEGLFE